MPIEVDATDGPAAGPTTSPGSVIRAASRPPGHLLRPGGHADLRSRGERQIALDALRLVRLLRRDQRPRRWHGAAFGRHVELVRAHLAPLGDTSLLAASFSREAMHAAGRRPRCLPASPLRVAYAVRWLELRDGACHLPWPELSARPRFISPR